MVGSTIEKLRKKNGGFLQAMNVVDASRKKSDPLHHFFEWNDTAAGEKWREQQARVLIGSVVVEVEIDGQTVGQRALESVHIKGGSTAYTNLDTVMKNPNFRKQMVDELMSIMKNCEIKLKCLHRAL